MKLKYLGYGCCHLAIETGLRSIEFPPNRIQQPTTWSSIFLTQSLAHPMFCDFVFVSNEATTLTWWAATLKRYQQKHCSDSSEKSL